jgi:hypothetical protein
VAKVVKQNNGKACGIFLVETMRAIASNIDPAVHLGGVSESALREEYKIAMRTKVLALLPNPVTDLKTVVESATREVVKLTADQLRLAQLYDNASKTYENTLNEVTLFRTQKKDLTAAKQWLVDNSINENVRKFLAMARSSFNRIPDSADCITADAYNYMAAFDKTIFDKDEVIRECEKFIDAKDSIHATYYKRVICIIARNWAKEQKLSVKKNRNCLNAWLSKPTDVPDDLRAILPIGQC